ncbi:hypothetical protein Tco_0337191 [Tanacetum coccineum]
MDLDHALRIDPPATLTATSTTYQKRAYEQWERSNRVLSSTEEQFKGTSKAHASTLILKMLTTKYDGVRERVQLIGELDNCLGSTIAYENAKLLREFNDVDLAKAKGLMAGISHIQIMEYGAKVIIRSKLKFGAVSFSCYSKWDMKFRDKVFPHRVGLTITSLDLLGVIEDEEFFSKLCDVDVIRVCLLLCLEVIFMDCLLVNEVDDTLMRLVDSLESWNAFLWGENIWMYLYDEIVNVVCNHKSEHREGLHKSRNYFHTYTLSGFVWAFKVYDGRKRNRLCRHISTPITNVHRSKISSIKDSVIKELNSRIFKLEAIIQVLSLERNGGVLENLKFGDEFCHLSREFCDELNHDTLNCLSRPFLEEEERLLLEEDILIEEEKRVRLEEQKTLMIEEERALRWDEDYRKRTYAFMNSDHMKQAMARCAAKKRTLFITVRTDSWLQIFITINEPGQHWCLAEFDIISGVVTFYHNNDSYDVECRNWYIRTRDCLQELDAEFFGEGTKLMGLQLIQLEIRLGNNPSRSFRPVKSAEILWQFWALCSLRVSLAHDGSWSKWEPSLWLCG